MSATGYLDACGFNPASGGTGDFVVSAAIAGYQTPASAGAVNSTVYSYRAQSSDLSQWENGFGAYTTGTTTLARTTVTASSTGSKVSFSSPPNVYITALSADLKNASILGSGTVATNLLGTGTASSSTFLRGDQSWATIVSTGRLIGFNVYSSSQTITIPAGATACFVRMVGGCGGNNGASTTGGGGAGALEKYLSSITAGNTLSFTAGAAGTSGNGGNSVLSSGTQSITTLTAGGGGYGGSGGTPGGATNGDINVRGQTGGTYSSGSASEGMAALGMGSGSYSGNATSGYLEIWWFS